MADDGCDAAASRDEDPRLLDYASAAFDPLRALYAESLPPSAVPPEAGRRRLFNNVAEFESYLKNPERIRDKKITASGAATGGAATGVQCPRTAGASAVTVTAVTQAPAAKSGRRVKNVLTRMENMQGPLSMLRKCVNERLRVSVVTRNYRCVRGVCKGYVIAFDKHWNLAMIDVDEEFHNPLYDVERRDEASAVAQIKKNQRRKRKMVAMASAHAESVRTRPLGEPPSDDGCASADDHLVSCAVSAAPLSSVTQETDILRPSDASRQKAAQDESVVAAITRSLAGFVLREPRPPAVPKTLRRHVNQLFIRGNNVVCVSFAAS